MDVGDVAHIVAPDNRPFIAPKGSEEGLRDAMERLLRNDTLRMTLGAANENRVKSEYDQDRMTRAYAEMFTA